MHRVRQPVRLLLLSISLATFGTIATISLPAGASPVSGCGPSSWFVVSSPSPGTIENYLYDVAGVSATDAWAVGSYFTTGRSRTLTEHFDGTGWTVIDSPNAPDHNYLYGVAADSATDVWAVGQNLQDPSTTQTLIERWNGTSWSIVPSPNPTGGVNTLSSVAAVAPDDAWAVGSSFQNGPEQTLTEHWNGKAWSVIVSPNPPNANNSLSSVVAVAADDVWAVGTSNSAPFIVHWDGNSWSVAPTPPLRLHGFLWDVTAVSAQDVWAVGNVGVTRMRTLIEHWDGKAWSHVASPNPGDRTDVLTGVAASSSNDACAIGEYRSSNQAPQALFELWNGAAWSSIYGPTVTTIYKVAALPDGHAWIVGWRRTSTGIKTLIEQPCLPCAGAG